MATNAESFSLTAKAKLNHRLVLRLKVTHTENKAKHIYKLFSSKSLIYKANNSVIRLHFARQIGVLSVSLVTQNGSGETQEVG